MAIKRKADTQMGTPTRPLKQKPPADCWPEPSQSSTSSSSVPVPTHKSPQTVVVERDKKYGLSYAQEYLSRYHHKVVQMPIEWFMDNCVAEVDEKRVEDAVAALKLLSVDGLTQNGRVRSFDTRSPSQMGEEAPSKFFHFVQAILNQDPHKPKTCKFPVFTQTVLKTQSENPTINSFHTDAFAHFGELDWLNTFLAQGLSLWEGREAYKRNRESMLWSGSRMLRNDARREFAFGLTINNSWAQLWRFSHSSIVVSVQFQWIEDPMPLIRLILSLAHYPQTKPEHLSALAKMGFDPTMELVTDSNGKLVKDCHEFPQYRIKMDTIDTVTGIKTPHVYETVEVLANHKAARLLTSFTRVWLVRRMDSPKDADGNEMHWVMKDCYADEGTRTEGEIWRDIEKRVREKAPEVDQAAREDKERKEPYVPLVKRFEQHFLQLEADQKLDPAPDVPQARLFRKDILRSQVLDIIPPSICSSCEYTESRNEREDLTSEEARQVSIRSCPQRKQRTLWKDANHVKPLDDLSDINHMHTVVVGTCNALEVLYDLNMIHGDVSNGNVYYDSRTKTGRLGDFEFVREYVGSQAERRYDQTGTPLFWSCEVQQMDYTATRYDNMLCYDTQCFVFAHHYLHDVESLHWLWRYILSAYAARWVKGLKTPPDVDPEGREDLFNYFLPSDFVDRYFILKGDRGVFPKTVLFRSWTVAAHGCVTSTLGKWIIEQYTTKLDPTKHSIAAIADALKEPPLPPATKQPPVKFEDLFLDDIVFEPRHDKECRFSQETFRHVFPELRGKLDELAEMLKFGTIERMERVCQNDDMRLMVEPGILEGGV